MAAQLLQVNMKLNMTISEYKQISAGVAQMLIQVPGLKWKIWLLNEFESEVGGIYLFENEAAKQAFIDGPLTQLLSHPGFRDLSVKPFDILNEFSAITHAPIELRAFSKI